VNCDGARTQTSHERARETYGRIPLSFEANRAEIVRALIRSVEYRGRFGQP
jgi:hypothetical protein